VGRTPVRVAGVIVAVALLAAGCGGGGSFSPTAVNTTIAGSGTSSAVASTTTAASGSSAPAGCAGVTSPSGAAKAPPVTDAAAVRDSMLAIAHCTPIPPGTAFTDTPIDEAWGKAYPNLKSALFASSEPTVSTFSVSSGFLTSRSASGTPHYNDRILGLALKDGAGRCAGGVIVIPAVNGQIASGAPTVFQPVDMAAAPKCSAEGAADVYQPGAV
jgi:hypothetical protein